MSIRRFVTESLLVGLRSSSPSDFPKYSDIYMRKWHRTLRTPSILQRTSPGRSNWRVEGKYHVTWVTWLLQLTSCIWVAKTALHHICENQDNIYKNNEVLWCLNHITWNTLLVQSYIKHTTRVMWYLHRTSPIVQSVQYELYGTCAKESPSVRGLVNA